MRLSRELDVGSVAQLADVLRRVRPDSTRPLIVELSGLTFIDASGLDALIVIHNRLLSEGKSGIEVWGASGIVRRLFEITHMGALLGDQKPSTAKNRNQSKVCQRHGGLNGSATSSAFRSETSISSTWPSAVLQVFRPYEQTVAVT